MNRKMAAPLIMLLVLLHMQLIFQPLELPFPFFSLLLILTALWMKICAHVRLKLTIALLFILIAMLFAAWKAPRWVKEAGLAALMLGWIYFMTGLYDISEIIGSSQLAGISSESKLAILFSGVRVTVIAPTYGMIVYCISLLLRIAVKPRI